MSDQAPVIVTAIDMHKGSGMVFRRALDLTVGQRGTLHFVFVHEPNIANVKAPEDLAPDLMGPGTAKAHEFVQVRVADYEKGHAGVTVPPVQIHAMDGDPAEQIVRMAAELDADLIVMGTHGRKGIKRMILGSCAERVVRLAGCPVLVVREKKHDTAGPGSDG